MGMYEMCKMGGQHSKDQRVKAQNLSLRAKVEVLWGANGLLGRLELSLPMHQLQV